jgi:hypothetical protein
MLKTLLKFPNGMIWNGMGRNGMGWDGAGTSFTEKREAWVVGGGTRCIVSTFVV